MKGYLASVLPAISHWCQAHRRRLVLVVGAIGWGWIADLNWHHPVLRFTDPIANRVFRLLSLALPLAAVVVLFTLRPWRAVLLLAVIVAPMTARLSWPVLFIPQDIAWVWKHGEDLSFVPIGEAAFDSYRVRMYRTDCGATCAYGVAVRQERKILPGIALVRQLSGFYPEEHVDYAIVGPNQLVINGREYNLRPLP